MTPYDLSGRSALITGASQGLGLEIARGLVRAGAAVCICGRTAEDLARAREELVALAGDDGRVLAITADVSRPHAVQALVAQALERFPELTALVNNAGVYGPMGTIDEIDWDAWVQAIEINLLGAVLTARALMAHFKRQGYGKIVQLAGGGATAPMPGISAYAASKAAVVRFAETLAGELRPHGIDVNAVAPGALNTRMLDEVLEAGPARVGQAFYDRALKQQESGGAGLQRGAELVCFLVSDASDGITGKLLSAIWDPWADLPEHRADLDGDVYTLRRIVPADRGLGWGDD
ncbi:MAG: SDR family NAD(P)-dependent oxidoreductase [Solirubrobacteraceae bacterium]